MSKYMIMAQELKAIFNSGACNWTRCEDCKMLYECHQLMMMLEAEHHHELAVESTECEKRAQQQF